MNESLLQLLDLVLGAASLSTYSLLVIPGDQRGLNPSRRLSVCKRRDTSLHILKLVGQIHHMENSQKAEV